MSGYFTLGEIKERPGVYHRYENAGTIPESIPGKTVAAIINANWGELNSPVVVTNTDNLEAVIGTGTGAETVREILNSGADEVTVVRAGSGGYAGTLVLRNKATSPQTLITVALKYPGNRSFSLSIGNNPSGNGRIATLYEGTVELESFAYTVGSDNNEASAFQNAISGSAYIKLIGVMNASATNRMLADITQQAFSGGSNPTINTEAYSAALSAIEGVPVDYICSDSCTAAVNSLLAAFVDRTHQAGAYTRAVVAEDSSVALATRMTNAAAFNDEKVIYVLNSWYGTDGTDYNGALAAARISGMCTVTPSSESLTHAVIKGAAKLHESLTNSEIIEALNSGCLVISYSPNRQVIIERAINTLVNPADNQDDGWKKIKRTDIRFELMKRIDQIIDPMIGKVVNNTDGRAAIIAAAQRVVDAMVGENKLIGGTVALDTTRSPEGDSAWFVIAVDDMDSLERVYLTYRFRFSENS